MTVHIMLDLETWGTAPGCDIRSIGACLFDPVNGWSDKGKAYFHVTCDNPGSPVDNRHREHLYYDETSHLYRKYPLTRDPATVQWWDDQSDEARAAFEPKTCPLCEGKRELPDYDCSEQGGHFVKCLECDGTGKINWLVDLKDALLRLCEWIASITGRNYNYPAQPDDIRLWSHGPSFDPPILAAAYAACGLSVPWHYRAPRDTRTALELAGMDPHKGLEPFNTGTHHNALDDAICQARAVCEAYRRLRVPHDVVTHRSRWRHIIERVKEYTRDNDGNGSIEERTNHARQVLERCSADRIGAMLAFSDEENQSATSLIETYNKTYIGGMSPGLRLSIERFAKWLDGLPVNVELPRYYPFTETDCPNHVSSNRTCANCGINISELEP